MSNKTLKNKKGISVVIGYILLVSFVIVMGGIVYKWMSSYVPKDAVDCPEETSIFVKSINFDCQTLALTVELQNNGRFNIDGYFIRGANDSNQELATIDLSEFFDESSTGGMHLENTNLVRFDIVNKNSFEPGDSQSHIFILDGDEFGGEILVEIIPTRSQNVENRERVVSCGKAGVREVVSCS